ncbi:MAG: metal ABC transporter solute-binding protein, Zn/Mn family, partial [Planctomycetaceae bacterium]
MSVSTRFCTAAWAVVAAVALSGCGSSEGRVEEGRFVGERPIRIVATTGMVADIVRVVAGEKAEVTALLGPNVDPHLHKPTRNDVLALTRTDIVFYSGLGLEGRMAELFENVARTGTPVVAVTDGVDQDRIRNPPEFEGHPDPHVWMDVSAWSEAVGFVAETLAEFDPPNAGYYQQNAEKYRARLQELDDYVRTVVASIPESQRVLVTAHDAFEYFSSAYGIAVEAPQGISTESQPGVDDINTLVDLIVERKVPAVFIESSVSPRTIQAIQEGAAAQGWDVAIGGQLYSDAMGPPGSYEGTYIGMMDHNATRIARALGGEAPEDGSQ